VLGSLLLGFIILTVFVSYTPIPFFDHEFSEEVQEHQNPLLDTLMKEASWLGYAPQSLLMVLFTSLVFFLLKKKREAFFITLTLLSGVIGSALKVLIDRPRPTEDLVRIIEVAKYQSFPSGHVLFYLIFFGFLIILMSKIKDINRVVRIIVIMVSALLIFTIPVSRIYLGAHWFTDVLGSILLGLLLLFVLSYLYLKSPQES
jgi:undecaprenyl-diphosphatase